MKSSKAIARQKRAKAVAEALATVSTEIDFSSISNKAQALLQELLCSSDNTNEWVYIEAIFADRFVFSFLGSKYEIQYVTTTGEDITFVGEPIQVVEKYVPKVCAIAESFSGTLTQKQTSDKGWTWNIQVISEGLSKSANTDLTPYVSEYPSVRGKKAYKLYTAEAIQDAVDRKLFDLSPMVLRSTQAHLNTQNGKNNVPVNSEIISTAAVTDRTYVSESVDDNSKVAAFAKMNIRRNESGKAWREFLMGRVAEGHSIPFECSITADIEYKIRDTDKPNPIIEITRFVNINSVDPCISGNAGGKILSVAESKNTNSMTITNKQKNSVLFGFAALCAKNNKKYNSFKKRIAEANDTEGEEGGSDTDVMAIVVAAFFKDNPAIDKLFSGDSEKFLASENANASLAEWLKGELAEKAGDAPDGEEDEKEEEPDPSTAPVAEGYNNNGKSKANPFEARLKALEATNKAQTARIAEAHMVNALNGLPNNLQELIKNTVKTNKITDTDNIDAMIRDAKKTMSTAESFKSFGVTTDERDKQLGCVINLLTRFSRPAVKAKIAESLGYDPSHRNYAGLNSLKEMLRSFDGFDISNSHGFGIDSRGKIAEAFDPTISTQLAFDAMHIVMQAEWDTPEMYDDWRKVTRTTLAPDFRAQNTENFGYFNSSDITERTNFATDYQELALTGVENAPYAIKDFGALFSLYWKDFVNDNVGKFQRLPKEIMNVIKRKLYFQVMDQIWSSVNTVWTGTEAGVASTKNICDATGWGNAPATGSALSYASAIEGYTGLMTVSQLGTEAVTDAVPRFLLHMVKDFQAAYNVTTVKENEGSAQAAATALGNQSLAAHGLTALKSSALPLERIHVPSWDKKNTGGNNYSRWFLMADPSTQECLNVFLYSGIQEPILQQEATGTGKAFSADAIRTKVHFPFNSGFVNPRGIWGNKQS